MYQNIQSIRSLNKYQKDILFSSKDPMYPCFAEITRDIQSKPKGPMYLLNKRQWISNI